MAHSRHEGRTWYTPYRGRLWIHAASKEPSQDDIREQESFYKARNISKWQSEVSQLFWSRDILNRLLNLFRWRRSSQIPWKLSNKLSDRLRGLGRLHVGWNIQTRSELVNSPGCCFLNCRLIIVYRHSFLKVNPSQNTYSFAQTRTNSWSSYQCLDSTRSVSDHFSCNDRAFLSAQF